MKKIFIIATLLTITANFWSCSDTALESESIYVDPIMSPTDFDNYLYKEYVIPYNINFKYKLREIDVPLSHHVIPASIKASKIMSVLLKHLYLEVYSEASPDGIEFVKDIQIREFLMVGSGAYDVNNKVILGEASGGKKITMYNVNAVVDDPNGLKPEMLLNQDYAGVFHTIHHEFCHILHQLKAYPQAFIQITPDGYVGGTWNNITENVAIDAGFITPYGMSAYHEDFVELYSCYVTMTEEEWQAKLDTATETTDADGNKVKKGKELILTKMAIVRNYIQDTWGMDVDKIRDIILRRAGEIDQLEFEDLK